MKFDELGLDVRLMEGLSYMGFEKTTPIQEQAIPKIMEGRDIIGCAQTGTGKTAAFILPVLHQLAANPIDGTGALVIAPTRELAVQIEQQIQAFAYFIQLDSLAVYGGGDGADFERQKKALKGGTDIIVATPGKLLSHLSMGYVKFDKIRHLILDEADRMLDMGFLDDILRIISHVPKERQSLLFSATMPPNIRKLASRILKDPFEINIAIAKPAAGVLQGAYIVHDSQKVDLVKSLIADKPNYQSILIFSSTKKNVSEIVRALRTRNYEVEGISSDYEQAEREKVLQRFRSRKTRVLVATDVLSRGIDIKDINLIINFDVPRNAEDYVHRVGRTARAETTGVALTLVNQKDAYHFRSIEKLIEMEVPKLSLPQHIGPGPEWKRGGQRPPRQGRPKWKGRRPNRGQKKGARKR